MVFRVFSFWGFKGLGIIVFRVFRVWGFKGLGVCRV